MKPLELKKTIYSEVASITKALNNANRLEILDLLAQGAVSVDYIASETGLSVANTSAHLQVLKSARLAESRKEGKHIFYQLASSKVFETLCSLRGLAVSRNAEIGRLLEDFRTHPGTLTSVSIEELAGLVEQDEVVVLDVRPADEYQTAHISSSVSIPFSQLQERISEIPAGKKVVAYCRGPFCLMADEAVKLLLAAGVDATRMEKGFPEWKASGLPVKTDFF